MYHKANWDDINQNIKKNLENLESKIKNTNIPSKTDLLAEGLINTIKNQMKKIPTKILKEGSYSFIKRYKKFNKRKTKNKTKMV